MTTYITIARGDGITETVPVEALKELKALLACMSAMTNDGRIDVFDHLMGAYCEHCGTEQDRGRRCQCWNDE